MFIVTEGNLSGHIISKEIINANPTRVTIISQRPFPHNKISMQSFFGRSHLLKKIIYDFGKTIKTLQNI
jgi:hypothetical protein